MEICGSQNDGRKERHSTSVHYLPMDNHGVVWLLKSLVEYCLCVDARHLTLTLMFTCIQDRAILGESVWFVLGGNAGIDFWLQ